MNHWLREFIEANNAVLMTTLWVPIQIVLWSGAWLMVRKVFAGE